MSEITEITPQQLLEIAQVMESEKNWYIHRGHYVVYDIDETTVFEYTPFNEHGLAQLLTLLMAVAEKITKPNTERFIKVLEGGNVHHILCSAHEILCNNTVERDTVDGPNIEHA